MMLMLGTMAVFASYAQQKNVNKANTAFTKGDYAEAISFIEPAILDEKTKEKGRTWYVRGQIYGSITMSEDESVRAIDANSLYKSYDSYKKVLELEKEGSTYYGMTLINQPQLSGYVMSKGILAYEGDDFESALNAFDQFSKLIPEDTTGFLYAAQMAQQLERYEDAISYYESVFDLGYFPKNGLSLVIYFQLSKLENPEKALEFAKLAQQKYPDESDYKKTEVDILIKMDKLGDAIAELKNAISMEPENAMLYSNLGLLYDSQDNSEAAVEQYVKALELDPSDRFSLINLAVFYIGQGDKLNKKAIDMDVKTYNKDGAKLEAEAKLEWQKALPLLEKVREANNEDELALQNLHAVYFKLKDYENAAKMEKTRRDLGYIVD